MTIIRRKTNKIETDPHIHQILNPTDKDFKTWGQGRGKREREISRLIGE